MVAIITQLLQEWNAEKNQRIKLQHAYFIIAILLAVTAGLVTLVNIHVGQVLVMAAAFVAALYFSNALIWALLEAFVMRKIPSSTKKR